MVWRETYCMDGISSLEPCQIILHALFWILASHGHLDQERQSEDSRKMRCIMALRQSFAVATSASCLPTLRQRPVGKAVLFTSRQHPRVQVKWTCLRLASCLSYFPFLG